MLFLVPSLVSQKAISIVVLPTIALMQDIKRRLESAHFCGIVKCLSFSDTGILESPIRLDDSYRTIYLCTPETLVTDSIWNTLKLASQTGLQKVLRIFIDEAHLALPGATESRQGYSELLQRLRELPVPKVLLTATLRPGDEDELLKSLNIDRVVTSFYRTDLWRENIALSIEPDKPVMAWSPPSDQTLNKATLQRCVNLIRVTLQRNRRVIIYCPTVALVKMVTNGLRQKLAAILPSSEAIVPFFRSLSVDEKNSALSHVSGGTARVVVATSAFGVGMDFPDIGTVIIYGAVYDLYELVQYLGRAGRDGGLAACYFLYDQLLQKNLSGNNEALGKFFDQATGVNGRPVCLRALVRSLFLPDPAHVEMCMQSGGMYDYFDEQYGSDVRCVNRGSTSLKCSSCTDEFDSDFQLHVQPRGYLITNGEAAAQAIHLFLQSLFRSETWGKGLRNKTLIDCMLCAIWNARENGLVFRQQQQPGAIARYRHDHIRFCKCLQNRCIKCASSTHRAQDCPYRSLADSTVCKNCLISVRYHTDNHQQAGSHCLDTESYTMLVAHLLLRLPHNHCLAEQLRSTNLVTTEFPGDGPTRETAIAKYLWTGIWSADGYTVRRYHQLFMWWWKLGESPDNPISEP